MSEVPIKHFWATPTSVLDMTPLTNRIAKLQSEVATLTRERDEARRALRIAAGVISTMKVWSDKHPQDAYDWIVAQAQTDASRTADAEVQP